MPLGGRLGAGSLDEIVEHLQAQGPFIAGAGHDVGHDAAGLHVNPGQPGPGGEQARPDRLEIGHSSAPLSREGGKGLDRTLSPGELRVEGGKAEGRLGSSSGARALRLRVGPPPHGPPARGQGDGTEDQRHSPRQWVVVFNANGFRHDRHFGRFGSCVNQQTPRCGPSRAALESGNRDEPRLGAPVFNRLWTSPATEAQRRLKTGAPTLARPWARQATTFR